MKQSAAAKAMKRADRSGRGRLPMRQSLVSDLPHYTLFYDARCRLCLRSRRALERMRPRAELAFVDVNDDAAMAQFPMVDRRTSLGQMFILDSAGRLAGGYDGFVLLLPVIPVLRQVQFLLGWNWVRFVGSKIYRWVARNRYRLGGKVSCESGVCHV
jgi:predicted DCC family thiol-disulfide oxidoreductase YuxK